MGMSMTRPKIRQQKRAYHSRMQKQPIFYHSEAISAKQPRNPDRITCLSLKNAKTADFLSLWSYIGKTTTKIPTE